MRKWPTPTTATGPTCNEGASGGAAQSASMLIFSALALGPSRNLTSKRFFVKNYVAFHIYTGKEHGDHVSKGSW